MRLPRTRQVVSRILFLTRLIDLELIFLFSHLLKVKPRNWCSHGRQGLFWLICRGFPFSFDVPIYYRYCYQSQDLFRDKKGLMKDTKKESLLSLFFIFFALAQTRQRFVAR